MEKAQTVLTACQRFLQTVDRRGSAGVGEQDLIDSLMGENEYMPVQDRRRLSMFVQIRPSNENVDGCRPGGAGIRGSFYQLLADLFVGPIYVRTVYALIAAAILGGVSWWNEEPDSEKGSKTDLIVYSVIYGSWLVFCVPRLLVTINFRLAGQVLYMLSRVFFAEIAVLIYAYHRGHNNILRRGFSLLPTLEANRPGEGLSWLGMAGYNLRLSSLLSCALIAFCCWCVELWVDRPMSILYELSMNINDSKNTNNEDDKKNDNVKKR